MSIEQLIWHDAQLSRPPDGDTVLVWLVGFDEPVFECAHWDSGIGWASCVTGGRLPGVTHWAEPQGPRA